jgi:hypothetical protein
MDVACMGPPSPFMFWLETSMMGAGATCRP